LTQDLDNLSRKKKKRPKKHLSEINAMVEALLKDNTTRSSQERGNKPTLPCKKRSTELNRKQNMNSGTKTGLRKHLDNKMSTRGYTRSGSSVKVVTDQIHPEMRNQTPSSHGKSTEHSGESNPCESNSQHYILETENNVHLGVQEGEQIIELSPEQCNVLLELFEGHGDEPLQSTDCPPQ
jgi:hypothetical protein